MFISVRWALLCVHCQFLKDCLPHTEPGKPRRVWISRYNEKAIGLTVWDSTPGRSKRFSCFPKAYPACCSIRYRCFFFAGVKRPGLEADHCPPSSAEVNEWSYTSAPFLCLHGVDRDSFTFTFINMPLWPIPCYVFHLTVFDRSALLYGKWKLWNSALCSFLYSPISLSRGPLFSSTSFFPLHSDVDTRPEGLATEVWARLQLLAKFPRDAIRGIYNTSFCQKNESQSKTAHASFWSPLTQRAPTLRDRLGSYLRLSTVSNTVRLLFPHNEGPQNVL